MVELKIPMLPRDLIKNSEILPLFVPLTEAKLPGYTERVSAMYLGTIGSLIKVEQLDEDGDIIHTSTSYIMNIVVVKDEDGRYHLYNDYDTSVDEQNSMRYYLESGKVKFDSALTEADIEELPDIEEAPEEDMGAAEDIIKEDIEGLLEEEEVDEDAEPELAEADAEGDGCEPGSETEDGTQDDNVGVEEPAEEPVEAEPEEALTPAEIRNRMIAKGNKPELPDFTEEEEPEVAPEPEPVEVQEPLPATAVETKLVAEKVDIEHDTTYVHPKKAEAPDDFASQSVVTERPVKDFAANDLKEKSQRPNHNEDKDAELARRRAEWKKSKAKQQENPAPKKHFIGNEKSNKPYQPKQEGAIKMPSSDLDDVF
jgi:hypothetical protein